MPGSLRCIRCRLIFALRLMIRSTFRTKVALAAVKAGVGPICQATPRVSAVGLIGRSSMRSKLSRGEMPLSCGAINKTSWRGMLHLTWRQVYSQARLRHDPADRIMWQLSQSCPTTRLFPRGYDCGNCNRMKLLNTPSTRYYINMASISSREPMTLPAVLIYTMFGEC